MILLIDTTVNRHGQKIGAELTRRLPAGSFEYIDTSDMKISHCLGCNYCWLKTPGRCVVKDDYGPLLGKISKASQIWLISDTSLGFVTYKTKNIIDRYMPLMTMYIRMVNKQMRHVPRYDHNPDIGIIYFGEADGAYLARWCGRVAVNYDSRSLGVFRGDSYEEAIACMR